MPDPATADTALPEGPGLDVVDLLLTQHARIEELFTLVAGATGAERQDAFDDLVRLLAAHEAAEQEVVHPLGRGLVDGGGARIADRVEEERQAEQMLTDLVAAGTDDPGFGAALLLLRDAVLTHARYEERYEFPYLRERVPADELRTLAAAVKNAQTAAAGRARPS